MFKLETLLCQDRIHSYELKQSFVASVGRVLKDLPNLLSRIGLKLDVLLPISFYGNLLLAFYQYAAVIDV